MRYITLIAFILVSCNVEPESAKCAIDIPLLADSYDGDCSVSHKLVGMTFVEASTPDGLTVIVSGLEVPPETKVDLWKWEPVYIGVWNKQASYCERKHSKDGKINQDDDGWIYVNKEGTRLDLVSTVWCEDSTYHTLVFSAWNR